MKKLFACMSLAVAPVISWAAGGTWDGIYSCNVNALSTASQVFLTINGQPNGQAIFAVAAVTPTTSFYGYGVGSVIGSVYSGTTNFGAPFSMTANAAGISGEIGIVFSGVVVNATANCTKIW